MGTEPETWQTEALITIGLPLSRDTGAARVVSELDGSVVLIALAAAIASNAARRSTLAALVRRWNRPSSFKISRNRSGDYLVNLSKYASHLARY